MNVLSTHAVALHGMNARESQRTPTSASTSSLIARKNTTRSHNNNTKKNINAARHRRRQRSIIRYARDNNWKDFRRFLTAPSSRDDDLSWVYDVKRRPFSVFSPPFPPARVFAFYCIVVVASFYFVVKPPPPPRVKSAFRVLFSRG